MLASWEASIHPPHRSGVHMDTGNLGRFIRAVRKQAGWTQEYLADLVGVDQAYISQIERGIITRPGDDKLELIANALGLPVMDLKVALGHVALTGDELARYEQRQAELISPTQPNAQLLTSGQSVRDDALALAEQLKAYVAQIGGTAWMRVIGRVPADALRWAEWENEERTVPIAAEWLGSRPASEFFVLQVSGDCLVPRKIHDGMLVLCRRLNGERPKNDRVVVVRIRDEYTLKVWREDGSGVWLEDGHGQTVARLDTEDDVAVIAVVTANWFHHEE